MLGFYLSLLDTAEEKERFDDLYRKYETVMYNYANKILKNKCLAEDAVHNSFMFMIKKLDRIKDFTNDEIKAYLLVTVKNAALAVLKENKNIIDVNVENIEDETDIEFDIETEYYKQRIWNIILTLNKIYSDTLVLKLGQGLTNTEIAEIMGVSTDVVNMRVHRARNKLKEELIKEQLYDKQWIWYYNKQYN